MGWLGMAVVLAGCAGGGKQAGGGGKLAPGVEKLIPPETVALVGVNVRELMKSAVWEKVASTGGVPAELDEFTKRTGLDVRRDLRELYIAADGARSLAIVKADIKDPEALGKEIESRGGQRTEVAGKAVYTAGDKVFALVDGGTAVAGTMERVRGAIEGYQSSDDGKRRAVLDKMAALPGGGQIWAVAVGGFPPMPIPERGNIANLNRVFASLESSVLSVDMSNGVALVAAGQCADDKMAKQLNDTLKALIGFGRLSTPSDKPELLKLFDGIQVAQDKGAVNVKAQVPADMVDFLVAQMKRR